MKKPLLKHEKQKAVRDYLWNVSNKRKWDIADFSIGSIKKNTLLKEKEIQDIVLCNYQAYLSSSLSLNQYLGIWCINDL